MKATEGAGTHWVKHAGIWDQEGVLRAERAHAKRSDSTEAQEEGCCAHFLGFYQHFVFFSEIFCTPALCSKLGEAEENQEHLKHKGRPSPPPGPAAPRVVLEQGSIPQTPRVPALTFGFISERKHNLAGHICPLISSLTTKPRQLLRAPARGKRSALPAALSGGSALKARIKNSPAASSAELH